MHLTRCPNPTTPTETLNKFLIDEIFAVRLTWLLRDPVLAPTPGFVTPWKGGLPYSNPRYYFIQSLRKKAEKRLDWPLPGGFPAVLPNGFGVDADVEGSGTSTATTAAEGKPLILSSCKRSMISSTVIKSWRCHTYFHFHYTTQYLLLSTSNNILHWIPSFSKQPPSFSFSS